MKKISIQDIILYVENYWWMLLIYFIALPIISFIMTLTHSKEDIKIKSGLKYIYSILIYLSCLPGIFSSVLTVYAMIFVEINLLTINILIYFLPIISMIATLVIIKRKILFNDIPGFGRLSALILLLLAIFIILFILHKLRILLIFSGPFFILIIGGIILYLLLRRSWSRLFGKKRDNN